MAFDAFALILAMLALGLLFARLRLFPEGAAHVLNLVVLYVCLPAAVLTFVPRLHLDPSLLGLMLTPWILMGCYFALLVAWCVMRWPAVYAELKEVRRRRMDILARQESLAADLLDDQRAKPKPPQSGDS